MKTWNVILTKKSEKMFIKLPKKIQDIMVALIKDLEILGPTQVNWPNYSKLKKNVHHCHIKKGNPTYVVCWTSDKKTIEIEVYYVGTHEKAPY